MKEALLAGGVVGALLATLAYDQNKYVDPHTVSVFPTLVVIVAVAILFVAMTWILQRRHEDASPSELMTLAMRSVFVASAIYAIPFIAITYAKWTTPTIWNAAMSAAMAAVAMMCVGGASVGLATYLLRPKQTRAT